MSWLNFANHFLSNQRLYVWSWINRTFSRMVFWRGIWLWLLWPFPFLFLFSAGQESRWHKGFWLAIKGRGPLQVVVSFLFFFACENSNIVRSDDLFHIFLLFSSAFWSGIFFPFAFSQPLIGNFLLFLPPNPWSGTFFFSFLLILDRELSLSFLFFIVYMMICLLLNTVFSAVSLQW